MHGVLIEGGVSISRMSLSIHCKVQSLCVCVCVLYGLVIVDCSSLPVPDPPSSPPATPLYNYQVSGTGQEFFFAVTR